MSVSISSIPLRRLGHWWIVAAAVIVSIAALLPVGFILLVAMDIGWATVVRLVVRPRVGELLVNTLLLIGFVVPLCGVLAIGLGWLTERSDIPGARIWSGLAVAPLAVPAFVQGYAWVTVFPGMHGLSAAVLVSVIAYLPFVYLPVAATLRRLDPALEDVAGSLGETPWRVFRRVVLPQLRLALCGGSLLIGLHLLAEYGLFVLIRFDTFTTAIIDQYQSTYNGAAANMLGGVLVVCCLGLLAVDAWARGNRRYARLGPGAARAVPRFRLGRMRAPVLLSCGAIAAVSLGMPLAILGRWLLSAGAEVWRFDEIGPALGQTLFLSISGGIAATLAAIPMAWLSIRAPGPFQRAFEGCNYMAGALPGVVIALALVTITVGLPIYQSAFTVILAYVLLYLPRAMLSLRASIAQAPIELEQVAGSLGHSPARALSSVTMRLAAPGAAAGMALAALGVTTELPATQMLAPSGTHTLATAFWSYSGEIDYASAAPYALLMILLSMPLTWLLYAQSQHLAGR
jgi:iron(III) transport system permease protein